jgi:hypothetical protein
LVAFANAETRVPENIVLDEKVIGPVRARRVGVERKPSPADVPWIEVQAPDDEIIWTLIGNASLFSGKDRSRVTLIAAPVFGFIGRVVGIV